MTLAIAVTAAGAFVLGYVLGRGAGIREHRALMRTAAAEWRACWLGDPPKAASHPPARKSKPE